MSDDCYHELFLHLTWHAKGSLPLIVPEMEPELYEIIRKRALAPGGVFVHEINGTPWHIHMVVRARPTLDLAGWIGRVKGGSSHDINQRPRWRKALQWQRGYGMVAFGMEHLKWVCEYVANQKERHRTGRINERLERIIGDESDETSGKDEDGSTGKGPNGSSQESKPPEGGCEDTQGPDNPC